MLSGKEGYEVEQTINGAWKASFQNQGIRLMEFINDVQIDPVSENPRSIPIEVF